MQTSFGCYGALHVNFDLASDHKMVHTVTTAITCSHKICVNFFYSVQYITVYIKIFSAMELYWNSVESQPMLKTLSLADSRLCICPGNTIATKR